MSRAGQTAVALRLRVEQPAPGVGYSLQGKDGGPLDPQRSAAGEPLVFDLAVRVDPDGKVFGDQVRREGPVRRFVYVRVGALAGDAGSPWSRRMKIDVHDMPGELWTQAMAEGGVVELRVAGAGRDGTPACATVPVLGRAVVGG